jgi:hypothetical protein
MELFDIYQPHNLQEPPSNNKQEKEKHLMLRTYDLMDFIKKFMRRIELAITTMGAKFIQKYCIEKMRGKESL